ncbi:eukaryotic translation initiation factor 2-alpha kinase-like [Phlebotomus argentipes]|uniref:eukaryotic translation initiation factor 2-alpha kinase-like n=1 Tax=Phlebotomus argentipes TaxID=94469 RepID=UPI0028931264|nr:eukaryotic translation initiation factor 2-alpha kinase-like [Phlebotomus argentipes]
MSWERFARGTLLVTSLAVTSVLLTASEVRGGDNVEKLTHCRDSSERSSENRLLFVTTLDGRLSALDVDGSVRWSVPTGPGSLLSSSIHSLELTNNGRMVRMIPSLSGSLYQFDGQTIEAIPITADQLLTASFKFSNDVVISGGKETRSYGISMRTGQVIYECSIGGCQNRTDALEEGVGQVHDPLLDDVIILRRQTQTVRAVDPRTGGERWNFSVGHHEMDIARSENCHLDSEAETDLGYEIKLIVPEGLVCAISKTSPNTILWKHKFDYPIVSAWQSDGTQNLQTLNLFDSAQSLWDGNEAIPNPARDTIPPSVYLGMFRKQVYIQESEVMRKTLQPPFGLDDKKAQKYSKIPWKPYPAATSAWKLIQYDTETISESEEESLESKGTALSVLYASEFVNGNGFYLYPAVEEKHPLCDKHNLTSQSEVVQSEEESKELRMKDLLDDPLKFRFKSLLFWWKEIFVIALTSSFVINLFINNRRQVKPERDVVVIERLVETPFAKLQDHDDEETEEMLDLTRNRSLSESNNGESYTSRFTTDFEMLQCLGKGGFGVVFEAKNKIDHCKYAIKRIVLPSKKESRDRVMREVRTLANCEHQNIVRYFQAWVETPPPGWQDNEDRIWMAREAMSTSIDIGTPTETSLPPSYESRTESAKSTPAKKANEWIFKLNMQNGDVFSEEDLGTKSRDRADDDSSFIQFEDSGADCAVFKNGEDDDDSFIEFRHNATLDERESKSPLLPTHFTHSKLESSCGERRRSRRKRPMSLDLTSEGGVIFGPASTTRMYLYIQMQLCQKQSLKEWLQISSQPERQDQVIPIFDQIVRAVEYVHEKGLIHRDLKPSNIFFSLDGQIKIGDFGLVTDMASSDESDARKSPLEPKKTHTQKVGTHLYMSPEQMAGKHYDYKVDIYSLGLILFELLVIFGTEMERIKTLEGVRSNTFPPDFPQRHTSEYALLQLMLSRDPGQRPTTYGIRARPPLGQPDVNPLYHFVLPPRRQDSRGSTGSSSGLSRESI